MRSHSLALALMFGLAVQAQTVTVMGSTALGPIVKKAADVFMKQNPGVQIAVSGGGSMTGLNQVAAGGCTIGISDVYATPSQEKAGLKNHDIVVQPFVLVTHPGVGVANLSAQQAEDLFTGKVTNWKDVGGKDQKVIRVIRPESSGTRAVQQKEVLHGKAFAKDVLIQDSTGAVVTTVASTPGAVSFVELEHLERNKARLTGLTYNGVPCTAANVKAGKYPLMSFGHAYTNPAKLTDPKVRQAAEAFIAFILSPAFQNGPVEQAGYLPVAAAKTMKSKL